MSKKEALTDHRGRSLMLGRLQQQAQGRKRSAARMPRWRRPVIGYVLSIPFVGGVSLGILWVQHRFAHFSFFDGPLLLAVMVIAVIWGIGPAIFSALLCASVLCHVYIAVSLCLDLILLYVQLANV